MSDATENHPDELHGVGDVVAVIVTYADRAERCIESARAALADGLGAVVIVDNGSYESSVDALREFASNQPLVTLHHTGVNLGSAGGFAAAIDRGGADERRYMLLLDDDNVVRSGSIEAALDLFPDATSATPVAVALPRLADPSHSAVLAGMDPGEVYARGGEFFEFDIRRRFGRRAPGRALVPRDQPVEIPRTPYGGLLLRKRDMSLVGGPRADFVLYCDDYEFTERYGALGGAILLSPHGGVVDRGLRWGEEPDASNLSRIASSESYWRAYYLFRNCAIVERARARRTGRRGWFALNGLIYSLYVVATGLRMRSFGLVKVYLQAQLDALRGRTGIRYALPGQDS